MNLIARQCTHPVASLRSRCFLLNFVRNADTSASESDELVVSAENEAVKQLKELQLEKKRNKSRLYPDHYAAYHNVNPYPEPAYDYHNTLRYKRRTFGKYGEASGVDPSALWPTKEELSDRKEYELVAHPFTIHEMVDKVKRQKAEELKAKHAREAEVMSKVVKIEQWKKDFNEKILKKAKEAAAAKDRKDRLVEEIRRHFGFKIDPRDDRFKEMLEKKEKEERKMKKAERIKARDQQLMEVAYQAEESAAKDAPKAKPEEDSDSDDEGISDDEDDTHPNIDTPSLFRWRHESRIQKMEEMQKEKEINLQKLRDSERKIKDVQAKIEEGKKAGIDLSELVKSLEATEAELVRLQKEAEEIELKEKKAPWNVDTISKAGFSKTIVNAAPRKHEELTDEEKEKRMREFTEKYEKQIKHFGMLRRYEDSKSYLQENPHLVSEDTANYLVVWCINLEMREQTDLMEHVAHQCICMQYMLTLAQQLDRDPRGCVGPFYSRIQKAEDEYKDSFDSELEAFKDRIKKRAAEKIEEAVKEAEEEERKQRLGPGGLDPAEVFESLPEEMQKCFESKSIEALNDVLAKMPLEEATFLMKRCVDSGLWIADASKTKAVEGVDSKTEEPTTG